MSKGFRHFLHSERQTRAALISLALLLLPVLLILVAFAKKYRGLDQPEALEHAQLARHLAAGDGFTTSIIRPVAITLHSQEGKAPDLYNAPLHPAVVALFFALTHPSGRVLAAVNTLLWLLAVWLTFFVGAQWGRLTMAALAAAFFALNPAAINGAIAGSAQPLLAILVLLAVWLALPQAFAENEETATRLPVWRICLTGAVCALATLTNYLLIGLVPVLGFCVAQTRRRKLPAVGWFLLGFAVPWLPWLVRNALVTGLPFSGLFWYELLSNTRTYPGGTIWRTVQPPPNPFWFVITNPWEMTRKVLAGAAREWTPSVHALGTLTVVMFVATLLSGVFAKRLRALLTVVTTGIILTVLAGALCWTAPDLAGCWAPLVAIVAAAGVHHAVRSRVKAIQFAGLTQSKLKSLLLLRYRRPEAEPAMLNFTIPEPVAQFLVAMVVVLAAALPLVGYVILPMHEKEAARVARLKPLTRLLPDHATVVTDQPETVAWYAHCRTVWLWLREQDWNAVEQSVGRLDAVYLTPAIRQLGPTEWSEWWPWLLSPRGQYRGFQPTSRLPGNAIARTRVFPGRETSNLTKEITRLQALVQKRPASAEIRVWWATRLLAADRLWEASTEFQEARRLDPQNSEAVLDQWQTVARLNDEFNSMALIQKVAGLEARDPVSVTILQEMLGGLERGLEQFPRDPWLLYYAALYRAHLGQWDRAEDYCVRLTELAPEALPAELLMGDFYLDEGQTKQAAVQFAKLGAERPRSAVAHEALGRVRWAQGQREEALKEFTIAQQLQPDWRVPYIRAGHVYLELRNFAAARQQFEKALELFPGLLPARLGLADVARTEGHAAESAAIYESVLADDPDNRVALNNLAYHYATAGHNLKRALELAQLACQVSSYDGAALDTLGWVLYLRGDYNQAVKVLTQAARLAAPDSGTRHFHLAKALLAINREQEAKDALRIALQRGLSPAQKQEAELLLATPQ